MTQEIKINVTLTLEADLEQTRGDMANFVRNLLAGARSSEELSLSKYHINRIEEEAEIYAPDPDKSDGV